jgi:hypothetical protein
MAHPEECAIVQVAAAESETTATTTSASEPGPVAAWLSSLPSWSETTERVQEFSQSTVDSLRKSAAATLRASASALEEASTNTASKMREAVPWVAGEASPAVPTVSVDDLRKGDAVFRKGLPAVFLQADHEELILRMDDTGNEISTECVHVSLGVEATQHVLGKGLGICLVGLQNKTELNGCHGSLVDFKADSQRWNAKLDSTDEVLCANPTNFSALLSPSAAGPKQAPQSAALESGAGVRLEGLQNRPQLNGCSGRLMDLQPQTSRWNVKLDKTAEIVCVHPRNILVVSAAADAQVKL